MAEAFDVPRKDAVRIVFEAAMTPWELVERVRMNRKTHVEVIIPPDHPALTSAVAVAYLGQELTSREGVVAVCGDKGIRLLLKRAGVLVRSGDMRQESDAARAASFARWASDDGPMTRRRKKNYITRSYVAVLGACVAVAIFLFSTVLPRADVVIIGKARQVQKTARFTADSRWREAHIDATRIRGKQERVETKVMLRLPISEMTENGGIARGALIFENQTGNEVHITPETPLASEDGIVYMVDAPVTIPPAIVAQDLSVTFGTVRAAAHAQLRGERGNRLGGRLTITTLPPQRQTRVYARIETSFTGGTNSVGKIVSDAHVTRSLPQAQEELRGSLVRALMEKAGDDWWAIPELSTATTTNVDVSPAIGSEAEEMTLEVRGALNAVLLMREDVLRLFELSGGDCTANRCQLAIPSLRDIDHTKGTAEGELQITRNVLPDIQVDELAGALAGKSIQDARHFVLAIPQVNDARIQVRRSIRSFLPRDPAHIKILIE